MKMSDLRKAASSVFMMVAIVALFLPVTGFAQTTATPTEVSGTFSDTISVGYVAVPFVALDDHGKPIADLQQKDVKVLVEGKHVALDMFERVGNAPVSYTILLDGSGSMGLSGKIEGARTAIHTLVGEQKAGDDYSLYVFADGKVNEVVPFTSDARKIVTAVDSLRPFGTTAFFDALAVMPRKSLLGNNGSRAIILLTDGFDNASDMTREQLARTLEGVDVPIYPLGLRVPGAPEGSTIHLSTDALQDLDILQEIAKTSGGRLSIVIEPKELQQAILAMEKDLRSQYLVGFQPTGRGNVRFRTLSLQLPKRARSVHVRAGYHGTEPPLKVARGR
ncbi:MAG: VWA domain-containing protein [Acidobacteriota bacterium]